MITVKVMIFFQLVNIDKMLDNTADPIADFINACCSDIIQYLATLSYEEFVENTQKLNDISTYKTLTSRAEMIGYNISKVHACFWSGYLILSFVSVTRLILFKQNEYAWTFIVYIH